jgi:hypothetical protein
VQFDGRLIPIILHEKAQRLNSMLTIAPTALHDSWSNKHLFSEMARAAPWAISDPFQAKGNADVDSAFRELSWAVCRLAMQAAAPETSIDEFVQLLREDLRAALVAALIENDRNVESREPW